MADRYAVIGNPVAHSKSPWIHARFARQTGQTLEYGALLAAPDGFLNAVEAFRRSGGKGLNVTLPFKQDACRLAARLSARALAAQAVNTLLLSEEEISGDNTDGCGLVRDLEANLGFRVAGQRVLLAGAGGAARGVLLPLLQAGPAAIFVANRSVEKARHLVGELASQAAGALAKTRLAAGSFAELAGEKFDLVVNATSAGLTDAPLALPPRLFAPGALAYDMVYGRDTAFLRAARAGGAARAADGLGMLVEQAAESFFLWRGVRPQTASVLAELRAG